MSSRFGEVTDPWDKFKSAFFNPGNFLLWVKRIFWGKKTRFKFSPRVDDVFSPRRLLTILPKKIDHFLPQEGENK